MSLTEVVTRQIPTGYAPGKILVPDGTYLGWFDQPVLVSGWAPYTVENDDLTLVGGKIQTFVDALASNGMAGVMLPGTYRSDQPVDVASNTTLFLHHVTLREYDTALGGSQPGQGRSILRLANATNVLLEGGILNGRKASISGTTEFKHGIEIRGGGGHTIRDMVLEDCRGDGMFFGRWTEAAPYDPPKDCLIERVTMRGAHRNNLSVTCGRNLTFVDCIFEDADGTAPEAGIDIEPNNVNEECFNITFVRPIIRNNDGNGYMTHPGAAGTLSVPRGRYTLINPTITGNGGMGVSLSGGNDTTLIEPWIAENANSGVYALPINGFPLRRISVRGGTIRDNGQYGAEFYAAPGLELTDILIDGTTVVQNAKTNVNAAGVNFGMFDTNPIDRWTITRSQLGDPENAETQYAGLRIGGDHVTNGMLTDNRFGNYTNRRVTGYTVARVPIAANNSGITTRNAGVVSKADGGTITHGLGDGVGGYTPTKYGVNATVAGEIATVTSVSTTTLTVAIKKHDGTAGTTQNISFWAEV